MRIVDSNLDLRKFTKYGVEFYGYQNVSGYPDYDSEENRYYYNDSDNNKVYVDNDGNYYYYNHTTGIRIYSDDWEHEYDWHFFVVNNGVIEDIDDVESYIITHNSSNDVLTDRISFSVTFFSQANPTDDSDYSTKYNLNWDYQSLTWDAVTENGTTIGYSATANIQSDVAMRGGRWHFDYPKDWVIYSLYEFHSEIADYEDCGTIVKFDRLTSVDFRNADDLSNVVNTESMFYGCSELTNVNFSKSDLNKVTDADSMFYNCDSLTENSIVLNNNTTFASLESAESLFYSEKNAGVCSESLITKLLNLIGNNVFGTNIDDMYLRFIKNNVRYSITSANSVRVEKHTYTGNLVIPATISESGTTFSVTDIDSYAFNNNNSLVSVNIQAAITTIEGSMFYKCQNLTGVTMPNTITSIGSYAFYNSKLTSIVIPDNVSSVGYDAFDYCYDIVSVTTNSNADFSNSSLKVTKDGIKYDILSKNTASVSGCSAGLTDVVIGSSFIAGNTFSVNKISSYAFSNSAITSVIIPNTITNIDYNAFSSCNSLTSVILPNSLTTIGYNAFYECSNIDVLIVPNSVTSIGNNAFKNVKAIVYNGTAGTASSTWGALVRYNVLDGDFVYEDSTKVKLVAYLGSSSSVTIPSSVTEIDANAFANCSSLTQVDLANAITIGNNAFYGCNNIESVTTGNTVSLTNSALFLHKNGYEYQVLSDDKVNLISAPKNITGSLTISSVTAGNTFNVEDIKSYAFEDCTGLTSITIPNTITTINDGVFKGCVNLVTFNSGNIESVGSYAFYNCSKINAISIKTVNSYYTISVKDYSFYNCTGLPNGLLRVVSNIPESAFEGSDVKKIFLNTINSLTDVGSYAFRNCTDLTEITLYAKKINDYAFYGCSSLTKIILGVTEINDYAFYGCSSLTDLTFVSRQTEIDVRTSSYDGYNHAYNLPKRYYQCCDLTFIGESAFENCTSLTDLNIPYSSKTIVQNERYGDNDIRSCTYCIMPKTTIKEYAFKGCTSLKNVEIDNFVSNDADGTIFENSNNVEGFIYQSKQLSKEVANFYSGLKYLEIGSNDFQNISNSISAVDGYIYILEDFGFLSQYELNNLETLIINKSNNNGNYQGYTYLANNNKLKYLTLETTAAANAFLGNDICCATIEELTLNANTSSNCSFDNYIKLKSLTIGDSVTTLANYHFMNLEHLTYLSLGKNITTINQNAFYGLTNNIVTLSLGSNASVAFFGSKFKTTLVNLTLGENVTTIPDDSFSAYNSLTNVTISDSILDIGNKVFKDSPISFTTNNNCIYLGNSGNPYVVCMGQADNEVLINDITIENNCKIIYTKYPYTNNFHTKNLNIPASVKNIVYLTGSPALEKITVNASNSNYSSDNYILFNKDKTALLLYPENRGVSSYVIPNTVTEIKQNAFKVDMNNTAISITIPSAVTTIGNNAFDNRIFNEINIQSNIADMQNTGLVFTSGYFTYRVINKQEVSIVNVSSSASAALVIPSTVTFGNTFTITKIGLTSTYNGSITSITIPNSVTNINANAFANCSSLTAIYYSGSATGANWGATNATLYPNN